MARIKFSIVAQKEYYSDELYCRVFIYFEFSILNHVGYFVILFLLFKNASYYFQQQLLLGILSLGKWLSFSWGQFLQQCVNEAWKILRFHVEPYNRVSTSVPKLCKCQRKGEIKSPTPKAVELNRLQIILGICACTPSIIRLKIPSWRALLMSQ